MNRVLSVSRSLYLGRALLLITMVSTVACDGDDSPDAAAASGDEDAGTTSSPVSGASDKSGPSATAGRARCADATMGTPCGDDKFCVNGGCVVNACGDGVKGGHEECDDGNAATGDGCTPSCRAEPTGCGNAKVDGDEECDDGNRIDRDACSNTCTKNVCGNKRLDVGEECDDGNKIDNDLCSNACLNVQCRNGRVDPGEECDDGNEADDDGCTNACKRTQCGNGKIEKYEECDDANTVNTDACSNHCLKNVCGNLRLDPGEECDDGASSCDPLKCVRVVDNCRPCEEKHCSNFMDTGLNVVAACRSGTFDAVSLPLVAPDGAKQPDQAAFKKLCTTVVDCARTSKCTTQVNGGAIVAPCFCGTSTPDACSQTGPSGGACTEAFYLAAETRVSDNVITRLVDPAFASGWATFLLQCDYQNCHKECLPGTP